MSLIPAFEVGIWNAWIFMIWLLIQNYTIRLVSKEVYQKAGEPPNIEPNQGQKITGYISVILWVLTTVYSIFLPFELGTVWFYIGLGIFLLGLIMTMVVTVNFTTTPINEPVTTGIYRYSRHPMYIAMILIYLSVAIASVSWIFLLASAIWLVLMRLGVADEEKYCLWKYGEAYRKYMNRTPRWIGIPGSERR